jgi:hypothetical protein
VQQFLTFTRKHQGKYQVGVQELKETFDGHFIYTIVEMRSFDGELAAKRFAASFEGSTVKAK